MNIIEVVSKSQKQSFLDLARALYKNDPNFACPLDGEIGGIFDPKENSFLSMVRLSVGFLPMVRGRLLDELQLLLTRIRLLVLINQQVVVAFLSASKTERLLLLLIQQKNG